MMMAKFHAAQTTPGANNNDDNSEAIVPLATGDEDPSSENRPRRRRRRGALNLDGRNLENSEDEEDDNAGGIINDRSQRAIQAQDDDELEGEDLHEEGYTADYRALPLLDTYEGRGIDRREYERISEDARFAAEAEMRQRDRVEMRSKECVSSGFAGYG